MERYMQIDDRMFNMKTSTIFKFTSNRTLKKQNIASKKHKTIFKQLTITAFITIPGHFSLELYCQLSSSVCGVLGGG